MNTETFELRDALFSAIRNLTGVEQALGHVTDVSTDYDMCQMLSKVLHDEIEKIQDAIPEGWYN